MVRRLLVAAYLIEAGLLLIVAPWTASWQHNYFAAMLPALGDLMSNEYVRGAVSGVGLITIVAGLSDLTSAMLARQTHRANAQSPSNPLP